MNKKLSTLTSPALAGVIRSKNARAAIAEIQNCTYDGATMIDLHLSCLDKTDVDSLKPIMEASKLPILALNYNKKFDWENADFDEEARVASLLRAVEAGAAGIDMQGYTFHAPSQTGFFGEDKYSFTKRQPREVVTDESIIAKQCELIDRVHSMGAEVLLSCHPGIYMSTDEIVELALFLEKRGPDIIKIVTNGTDTEEQMIEAIQTILKLKKEVKTPITYHANGKAAAITRVLNPILGGHMVFCVDHYDEGSTMMQVDLKCAKAVVDGMKKII